MKGKLRKARDELNKKHEDYYGRQFSSIPSSMIAYRIACGANKNNNGVLWMAMVGLTSLFV